MRVYVPLTLPALQEAHKAGELGLGPSRTEEENGAGGGDGPLTAYAVTPALREWYVSNDAEELEYAALGRAAAASLRLLAAEPGAARRRVVVAADVPEGAVTAAPEADALGEVRVEGSVFLSEAAAVHVDADEAEPDVAAAADVVEAADAGDDDAQFTVDGADDHELLWYATQEIPNLFG